MYRIAKLSIEDRKALFDLYSFNYRESPEIVEKDFWVTLLLDYLFNKSEYKDYFIFKGGTSLSKCFNIIDRFSEDIDLILDWTILGFSNEDIYQKRSNTLQGKYNFEINEKALHFIKNKLKPSMEKDLEKLLGFTPSLSIEDDRQVLSFNYPNIYNTSNVGILQCVRLEIGPLAEKVPVVTMNIQPLVSKLSIPIMTQIDTTVKCISPERTFWEKVLILHQEAHRPKTKIDKEGNYIYNSIPSRYSRHYYDVYKISQTRYYEIAKSNINLLEQIIKFKKKFYHYSWDNLENALPGSIVLIPQEYRLEELRKDFISMKEMINDDSIKSFDELVVLLKEIEIDLNK